jgi:penicillin-binding protein 1C
MRAPALPRLPRLPRIAGRLRVLVALAGLALVALTGAWRRYRSGVGEPSLHLSDRWHEGHLILDRRGATLRELPSEAGQRGQSLPLEALGDRIIAATLVSEDRDFWGHEGIDRQAIVRAFGQNLSHGRLVSGASTITQQLVKLLDNEGRPRPRTIGEKLKEAARAENLERVVSKREILEAYLNRLSYGHGLAGPEAAAKGYFGKRAQDLSWAEAAYLAVLPRAPSYLDPYGHAARIAPRQRALLDALHDHGFLDDADHARAASEIVATRPLAHPFLAPHFVAGLVADGALAETGTTRTTLDLPLQSDVEGLVRTHLAALADEGAGNAAVMVVDNASGEVLAYAGSADFDDPQIAGQLDVIRARRQPGSTLKPFVYAMAFARGRTGADVLADVPTSFPEGRGAYTPGNFDGTFEGPISAREALAGSLNVPAIRLAAELPAGALLDTLHALGLASLDRNAAHYGLALALGSGEVELRELCFAYVALARGGERVAPRSTVASAAELGAPAPGGERIFDAGIAATVTDILSDPLARIRGLHGRGPFDLGFPVAVKTGTSSGFRDTWTAGYTHERTVAVWVGNSDGAPTRRLTGASGAGPLFADVMRRVMRDVPARAPLWDEALLESAEVCPLSGKLAGPACPDHAARRFVKGHVPTESCEAHVFASPRTPAPDAAGEAPYLCDPRGTQRVALLPEVFDAWLAAQPIGAPGQDPFGLPWLARSRLPGCSASAPSSPELRIEAPSSGSVYLLSRATSARDQAIEVRAAIAGDPGRRVGMIEFVVDGEVAAQAVAPYRARIPLTRGDHEILARPADPAVHLPVRATRFSVR